MKNILAGLVIALAVLVVPAHALSFSFSNTAYDRTDFTVDWSDGVVTHRADLPPPDWNWGTQNVIEPASVLGFVFSPSWLVDTHGGGWMISFILYFQGPRWFAEGFDHCIIGQPEYISLASLGSDSITFHIDSGAPVALAPDSGPTWLLLALGLAVLARKKGVV